MQTINRIYLILVLSFFIVIELNSNSEKWYTETIIYECPAERLMRVLDLPDLSYNTKVKNAKKIEKHIKNFEDLREIRKQLLIKRIPNYKE